MCTHIEDSFFLESFYLVHCCVQECSFYFWYFSGKFDSKVLRIGFLNDWEIYLINRPQFSMVYTLTDHRNDVIKCSKFKWNNEPQASLNYFERCYEVHSSQLVECFASSNSRSKDWEMNSDTSVSKKEYNRCHRKTDSPEILKAALTQKYGT